jgi:hypothetical protein
VTCLLAPQADAIDWVRRCWPRRSSALDTLGCTAYAVATSNNTCFVNNMCMWS